MPSLRTFRIIFERPGAVYMAGEMVTGTIILDTAKDVKVRGFYFTAKGAALVEWQETKTLTVNGTLQTIHETYTAHEHYFTIREDILEPVIPDSRIRLSEGYHEYQFKFQLPSTIPSSFEHSHGYVRYTVKATIDRPWKFDHVCKVAFTVVSILDLNLHRDRCLGIHDEIQKNFFCCCFNQGSMNISVRVPSSGYVPGQTINALVNFTSTTSKVRTTKISLKLERVLMFHATSSMKVEKTEITSVSHVGRFITEGLTNLEMKVPPIPPSHMPFCKIMNLDYYLTVVLHFTGTHLKVQRTYPLLIGSIPLYCAPSAPDIQQINGTAYPTEEPTTSNATSMPEVPQPGTSTANTQSPPPGFVNPNQANSAAGWNIPSPSYEECTLGAQRIRDDDESVHFQGTNAPFRPKYPVFDYPAPNEGEVNPVAGGCYLWIPTPHDNPPNKRYTRLREIAQAGLP
ncbi:arrestin domain-containing protein 17-like [Augochlora pura]